MDPRVGFEGSRKHAEEERLAIHTTRFGVPSFLAPRGIISSSSGAGAQFHSTSFLDDVDRFKPDFSWGDTDRFGV